MSDSIEILPVIVIRTPESRRIEGLLKDLKRIQGISIHLLDATMTRSPQDLMDLSYEFDKKFFEFYMERKLLTSEIGCAISHNRARTLATSFPLGALILEDDAEIVNFDFFKEFILTFLKSNSSKSSLLSLYNWQSTKTRKIRPLQLRIFGTPRLAIGYAITPEAASSLVLRNTPVKYPADWPPSDVDCYVAMPSLILPREELISTIDPNNERYRKPSINVLLSRFFGLDFFFYYKNNFTFRTYFQIRWWPRVLWRMDNIKLIMSERIIK